MQNGARPPLSQLHPPRLSLHLRPHRHLSQHRKGESGEAAHIHQHDHSGNDEPGNGLALTPDAHWMFDRGLWTVEVRGDDLIIRVAKGKFRESSLSGFRLAERDDQPLIFVTDTDLRPEGRHFLWHREKRFVG